MNLIVAALVASMLYAASALGAEADGNYLLLSCRNYVALSDGQGALNKNVDAGYCAGVIHGTIDIAATTTDSTFKVCLPPSAITQVQGTRVVIKYLEDHPEELHLRDTVLILMAFKTAFPCKS